MKLLVGSLALIATFSSVQAGGFGGPPPFTNGSPLLSGTDGSYQASARGNNTSGIIRFRMNGGNQTFTGNDYAIFSEGLVYTGTTQASIMTSNISGILGTSGTITGHTLRGFFNAKLNQNSAFGSFSGNGEIITANGVITNSSSTSTTESSNTNTQTNTDNELITGDPNVPPGQTTTNTSTTETSNSSTNSSDSTSVSTQDLNDVRKIGIKVKGVRTTTTGT